MEVFALGALVNQLLLATTIQEPWPNGILMFFMPSAAL
jgi:hypothetical protein